MFEWKNVLVIIRGSGDQASSSFAFILTYKSGNRSLNRVTNTRHTLGELQKQETNFYIDIILHILYR